MSKVFDVSWCQDTGIIAHLAEDYEAEGIIIKLGETETGCPALDDNFYGHFEMARGYNLPIGIYYVSHAYDQDAMETEAAFIRAQINLYFAGQEPELGIFWDMEVAAVQYDGIEEILETGIRILKENFTNVGVYANASYFEEYIDMDWMKDNRVPLWLAQYNDEPDYINEYMDNYWAGWQFTEQYNGENLDCSEWYGCP